MLKQKFQFRIWTEIFGGLTGHRSSYMKQGGKDLYFNTREEAKAYISECRRNRSAHAMFSQTYEVRPS